MISFTCPGCRATFKLPDELAGKPARCSKCDHRFTVPGATVAAAVAEPAAAVAAPSSSAVKKVALKPVQEVMQASAAKPFDDVEVVDVVDQVQVVEEDPTRKDPPRRRASSRDDDDDDYDRPRRRRRSRSGGSTGIIIGSIVGGVVFVATIVVVIVLVVNRSGRPQQPVVVVDGPGNAGNNPGPGLVQPAAGQVGVILDRRDRHTRADPFDRFRPGCRAKTYSVQLEANRTYKIEMIAEGKLFGDPFDPYLRIEHNGINVAEDDDSGGGIDELDALIIFRPQQTGAYTIVATAFDRQLGSYRLVVTALP